MEKKTPFLDLHINDWSFLDEDTSRYQCSSCQKSRKYFCYTCNIALPHIKRKLPHVKLPVKVDIIKHPSEIDGKSTSTHAAILASDDVSIHSYPTIPDYENEKVVLVFPGQDSVTLEELLERNSVSDQDNRDCDKLLVCHKEENRNNECQISSSTLSNSPHDIISSDLLDRSSYTVSKTVSDDDSEKAHISQSSKVKEKSSKRRLDSQSSSNDLEETAQKVRKLTNLKLPFEKVVFIDSTWNQTRNIISDERLKGFQKVELKSRNSNFWRKQQGIPNTYLSTIEAIYYFMKHLHTTFIDVSYNHEYDNLLFFFCFMYDKIVNNSGKKVNI